MKTLHSLKTFLVLTLSIVVVPAGVGLFPSDVYAITCDPGALSNITFTNISGDICRGFITATGGGNFTLPSDWSTTNQIEVIGGGGAGGLQGTDASAGGGGGAYS